MKEVVTPGSIHDVLRLRGGGKEDSSSEESSEEGEYEERADGGMRGNSN